MKMYRGRLTWIVILLLASILAGCSRSKLPDGPDAVWDLVVIGDSSMWHLGKACALQIEKDRGIKVVLDDFALPALSAGKVREVLETGTSPNMRLVKLPAAVKNAEVVILFVNPRDSVLPYGMPQFETCFNSGDPGADACTTDYFAGYTEDLKAIWQKIIDFRSGKATLLYATDIYNPLVDSWKITGAFANCTRCWENISEASRQAAEGFGIPFFSRLELFNGSGRDEDPEQKGYISNDGEHPSLQGAEAAALAMSRLGYEPVIH